MHTAPVHGVVEASAPAPAPAQSEAENPFLLGLPPRSAEKPAPAPVAAPVASPVAAAPVQVAPRVIGPVMGAPLRVDPTVAVPNIRDPHAEFRRGSWKKPALFAGVAAALLGGLTLLPEKKEEKPTALDKPPVARAGIGTSLPPGRTTEDRDDEVAKAAAQPVPSEAPEPSAGASRTSANSGEASFGKAFREAAKK